MPRPNIAPPRHVGIDDDCVDVLMRAASQARQHARGLPGRNPWHAAKLVETNTRGRSPCRWTDRRTTTIPSSARFTRSRRRARSVASALSATALKAGHTSTVVRAAPAPRVPAGLLTTFKPGREEVGAERAQPERIAGDIAGRAPLRGCGCGNRPASRGSDTASARAHSRWVLHHAPALGPHRDQRCGHWAIPSARVRRLRARLRALVHCRPLLSGFRRPPVALGTEPELEASFGS
jgi:hypothetical protein